MKEILGEIKGAEKKAESISEETTAKKQEVIQKARQDSFKLVNENEAELDKKLKEEIDKKTLELDDKKKGIILKSKKESESLEKKSKDKIPAVVDYIIDKFEKSLE